MGRDKVQEYRKRRREHLKSEARKKKLRDWELWNMGIIAWDEAEMKLF